MTVFAVLVAGTLFVAWRAPAATGAVAAAAAFVFVVFAEWAVLGNPDMLVLPGGPLPASAPSPPTASVSLHLITAAIFAAGFGVAGFLAQGRFDQRHHSRGVVGRRGVHAAGAVDRALCPHRASRPLDPVCDPGRAARRGLWRGDRNPQPARQPAGPADLDRAVRHRHARRAGAGADLCARKRLAHDRAGADVDGHGVDFDAAADPVPALARRHPRRHRGAADRLRAAHRRRRRRHHPDLQLAVMGLRRSGGLVLDRRATSCAAAATTRRCARWSRRRSCSRSCWRSWKSAMPSTAATSTAPTPSLTEFALEVCVALAMAIGLERSAHPHRQHRSQYRRGAAHGFRRACRRVRAAAAGKPADLPDPKSAAPSSTSCCSAMRCRPC